MARFGIWQRLRQTLLATLSLLLGGCQTAFVATNQPLPQNAQGTPVLQGALAYLECRLHSAQLAGDHTIFIAEVEDIVVRDGEPLLYFRSQYRNIESLQA